MGIYDKLKPCPFCGAKVDLIAYFEGGVLKNYAIHCHCCGMETVLCTETGACDIQYWVFKAWNRRNGDWNERKKTAGIKTPEGWENEGI